jgi:hypothetical protein
MIKDASELTQMRRAWAGVEILRERLLRSGFMSFAGGGNYPFALVDAAHHVPFLHAHTVLEDALEQLAIEGAFPSRRLLAGKRPSLGDLSKDSRNHLPWQDHRTIRIGIVCRNKVAHDGELLPRADCWKHINAIGRELHAWGVIDRYEIYPPAKPEP